MWKPPGGPPIAAGLLAPKSGYSSFSMSTLSPILISACPTRPGRLGQAELLGRAERLGIRRQSPPWHRAPSYGPEESDPLRSWPHLCYITLRIVTLIDAESSLLSPQPRPAARSAHPCRHSRRRARAARDRRGVV